MDASNFDQFTRAFGSSSSRRRLLALAGGLVALRRSGANAAQALDSCASTGNVCTLLYGCCSGLTCATSSINPSYGVCIPGEGGMVSTGTALVVPFDEGDITAAPVVDTTTDTTTTDVQAEREQKIAEKKARKDAHRNRIELRRDDQKDRKDDQQDRRDLARGPELEFRLLKESDPEALRVTNTDNVSVVLTLVESLLPPFEAAEVTPPFQLASGESFLFTSGELTALKNNRLGWINRRVCTAADGGIVVHAAFGSNSDNFEYEIRCDGPSIVLFDNPDKKKRGNSGNNRKRKKHKSRKNKKHKNG